MRKDPEVFIGHIIECIQFIEEYSYRVSEKKFKANQVVQDAIIRRLEIIGEAVKNIPTSFKSKHPDIPWRQMAGMRDVLIHEYFDIDLTLTWLVVKGELPNIKKKLLVIITE